jgi:hypothetical protein
LNWSDFNELESAKLNKSEQRWKQATALNNPSYVLAAFTDVIFCKQDANIVQLDDDDMQQSSLSNILQEVKMQQSIGGIKEIVYNNCLLRSCVVACIKTTINLFATIQNILGVLCK